MLDDVVFCFYGKLLRILGIMGRWAAGAKVLHVGNGRADFLKGNFPSMPQNAKNVFFALKA